MAFSVVSAGTSLQLVFSDGSSQTVTLPIGVSIVANTPARFAILGRNVIVVNAVSRPIWIDPDGIARPLSVSRPSHPLTMSAGAAGGLTGSFVAAVSFTVKDDFGNVLLETPLGPLSDPVTVAAQTINSATIPLAGDAVVNGRRVYRSADGPGEELFFWFDIDDNATTTYVDDTSDEALATLPANDELGEAPLRAEIIIEWKGRLWAKNTAQPDSLLYSALGLLYAFSEENEIIVQPVGRDRFGITGFIKRRDELGICRRDIVWKVTGSSPDDFALVKVVEGKGCVSHDTIVVVRDVARFLGDDGIYEWDNDGIRSISEEDVHPWFSTDDYFNRALFPKAFSRYNPIRHAYDVFLAAAGSSAIDRWVSYDITRKKWMGIHKTDEFSPTCAGTIYDVNELLVPVAGSSTGYLYRVTPGTYTDGAATAIALDVTTKFHSGKAPDLEHQWLELSILTRVESAGTLTITPKVGRLDAAAQAAISHSLTTGRQRLRRLGPGALAQFRFQNSEAGRRVELYGYELPFFELGRR